MNHENSARVRTIGVRNRIVYLNADAHLDQLFLIMVLFLVVLRELAIVCRPCEKTRTDLSVGTDPAPRFVMSSLVSEKIQELPVHLRDRYIPHKD